MKTLTVRQPWAWAIAKGYKPIENRGWTTAHRGILAIHTAKVWDTDAMGAMHTVVRILREQFLPVPRNLADELPLSDVGVIVATVYLVDICTASLHSENLSCACGPWAQPGSAHWKLESARRLSSPIEATGRLGLWDYEVPR